MYASGITYTGVSSVSPAAGATTGANNGLSVSSIDPTKIVLGQNIGQLGSPADLLSARQINMKTFYMNYFGGQVLFSDVAIIPFGGRVQIGETINDAARVATLNFSNTIAAVPTTYGLITANVVDTAVNTWNYLSFMRNTFEVLHLDNLGNMFFGDAIGGRYATISNTHISTPYGAANLGTFRAAPDYSSTSGSGTLSDFISDGLIEDIGTSTEWVAFNCHTSIQKDATSSGNTRGFYFQPGIVSIGTGKLIAIENKVGDVYLNSTTGSRVGRTGIHVVTTPTAWLHLGAGATAVSSAPLKFSSGTNQTTAEPGAMEYNGTNLFFTRTGTTRETVLTGNSGATAPGLTATPVFTSFYGGNTNALGDPNSWASVVIGGTTFKIPLYT